jgi:hypothetical protein
MSTDVNSTNDFKMDYQRNKHYFFPTPKKKHSPIKIGLWPIIAIIIGCFMLILSGGVGAVIVAGLTAIVIGIAWIAIIKNVNKKEALKVQKFNNNRIIVSDSEIDKAATDYLEKVLKSKALKKLGIDEEQVQEIAPIKFNGYDYKNLVGSEPKHIKGEDGRIRSSHYNAVIFFFSAEQVYCYQLRLSLWEEDRTQETTEEYFYRDIVSVSTNSEPIIFEDFKIPFNTEYFKLTTTGGTYMQAYVFDMGDAERSIQSMRQLLRNKKRQT